MLDAGVVTACHDSVSVIDIHALTLARTVTLAPMVGAHNTTSLLRPKLDELARCEQTSRVISFHSRQLIVPNQEAAQTEDQS